MPIKVDEVCVCGVRVRGELDAETREFIYRFVLPPGADALVKSRSTEVEGIRLLTLTPDLTDWAVDCPICGGRIPIPRPRS